MNWIFVISSPSLSPSSFFLCEVFFKTPSSKWISLLHHWSDFILFSHDIVWTKIRFVCRLGLVYMCLNVRREFVFASDDNVFQQSVYLESAKPSNPQDTNISHWSSSLTSLDIIPSQIKFCTSAFCKSFETITATFKESSLANNLLRLNPKTNVEGEQFAVDQKKSLENLSM